ncbi:helix-turn-helix transcriptional regulator [Marivirga sp. S37H4]|uniref:Helix-turn-helix transcriptional regulator n=1 Tax=Marivirga aurantiaca TaxID=2802615 RepID=A0A935C871_9BACT|nr:helix-turn-helix transcriptional regulator [Marivirga aurantiaca]MBK6263533.1 helix-turn-helix transcriptional regulator [Marivirga aurantiaca]
MSVSEDNVRLIFGLKVRQLRQERKMSFAQLAQATGLSPSYLNEIEKGKKYPKAEKIGILAEALEVQYDWLISLQLSKNLAPVSELLKSNLLTELPLELFGLEPATLLELLSNAPDKLGAFLSTIIEISRNYGMRVENLYFNMLRSYQEMYDNYFPELEKSVEAFRAEFLESADFPYELETLERILTDQFHYRITDEVLQHQKELSELRSVFLAGKQPQLLMNGNLNKGQKAFVLGQEIAYSYLKLKPRPKTTAWLDVDSFEEVLNNYKASYFSCALAIPKQRITPALATFLKQEKFDAQLLLNLLEEYKCSPENLFHRLTNLLPKEFGIRELFFLRFNAVADNHYKLTKEMHLSGLHNPHGTAQDQHYCRRWISIDILNDIKEMQEKGEGQILCKAQRSKYVDSDNEYLIMTFAKPASKSSTDRSSVSIGLLISPALKRRVKFWNDPAIPIRLVNETCELCSLRDCAERAAPATVYEARQKEQTMKKALKLLQGE